MKKKLLLITTCLVSFSYFAFSQAFTPGNIVVYRYGDGVAAMPAGLVVPVFLDEYSPTGTLVRTLGIPATSNGANFRLSGLGRLGSGAYQTEGMSTLSQDGKYLAIFGYNQAPGNGTPTTADGLVVGIIAADGSYNSTTTLSNEAAGGLGAPRSAVINGTDIWANGYQNGIHYTTLGSLSNSTRVSVNQNSPRAMTIFNNTLYAPIGGGSTLASANPLPTTSTTLVTQTIPAPSPTNNQVALFTVGTRTIMYLADDGASTGNTIRRYYLNTAGTAFVLDGTVVTSIPATSFVKSITGVATISGINTIIDLYATSWGNDGNGTEPSKLFKLTDTYITATPSNAPATSAISILATALANTVFRSVTLAPTGSSAIGTGVLPVSLTSFSGKKQKDVILLSWATAYEKNNAYYEILRSADGRQSQVIGKVTGKGYSDVAVDYSFTDQQPLGGVNYYQLKQIDLDGRTVKSKLIAVESGLKNMELNVNADKHANLMKISVFSANATTGDLLIYDLAGRKLLTRSVVLSKGYNSFSFPLQLKNAVFVATLKTPAVTISKKF